MELRAVIDDPIDLRTAVDLLFSKHCPETHFRINQSAFFLAASAELNDYNGRAFAMCTPALGYTADAADDQLAV